MESILEWISDWFVSYCNGDWEHENIVKITTVSNPGWHIEIDLIGTPLETVHFKIGTIEKGEDDWYFYGIENGTYEAAGDMTKLSFLLHKFRETVEEMAS